MTVSLSQLIEDSFQIAWEYLERSGELGDGALASRFLSDVIETMIRRGQRSRLALSNRGISAYQRFRSSGDAGSEHVRSSA
jgi:DNA-binding transcriptional regulator of glucitol operon